jgi:hypothetical protein
MIVQVKLPDDALDELVERVAAAVIAGYAQAEAPWRLLNVEEAATCLGRSTRWVRERVRRGDLAHVRLDGGALAFDAGDLRAFANARRVGDSGTLASPLAGGR